MRPSRHWAAPVAETATLALRPSFQARLVRSWTARGPLAWLLLPVSLCYALAVACRHALYRACLLRTERLPVPVVVVGNLVAGGAGKTPTVLALVSLLRGWGWTPGVVSRGHGGRARSLQEVTRDTPAALCGDEPLLLHLRSGAPVVVGRNRPEAGRELLRHYPEVNILLCDDGLQHRKLARDVQLIVFDERGAGNGWLLPAGPLREPLPNVLPARTMVIYNANTPSTNLPGFIAQRSLAGATPLSAWWAGQPPELEALTALVGRPLLAVAGVSQPSRFFAMLRAHGLHITECPLPDHHDYSSLPWPVHTPDVIVTEKDAVKLPPQILTGTTRVWVARLDLQLAPAVGSLLSQWLPPPPSVHKLCP